MKYKKVSMDKLDIHIIQNSDFHTIEFRVYLTENLTKEKITYRNALVDILTYASKRYDTKEKLIKRCQDLYSLQPMAAVVRNGNLLTTKFGISTIDSIYVEKENLIENILLLKEIILNPLIDNEQFSSKYFSIMKDDLKSETNTINEEPRLYANIQLLKLLNDEEEKIFSSFSDLNVLSEMTEKSLFQSYQDLINNSKVDIFVIGNIHNSEEIINVILQNFKFPCHYPKLNSGTIIHTKMKNNPLVGRESRSYQQSKLSVGYKLYGLTEEENRYACFIFNLILGAGNNSLLMRYVREKKGLCYYIGSYINRLDNILIINSGINKNHYDDVLKCIDEVLDNVRMGKFTMKDIKAAKMEAIIDLSSICENPQNIVDYYFGMSIFNSSNLKEKSQKIKNVSKNDIIEVSKKIKLDSIFLLEGDL